MVEVSVVINGHPVQAYVDSGADRCVMNRSTAARCNLLSSIQADRSLKMQGVSGSPVQADGVVTTQVQLGRARTAMEFVVIDTPDASFQVLLGLEWCTIWELNISFSDNSLVLNLGRGDQIKVPFGRAATRAGLHFAEASGPPPEPAPDPNAIVVDSTSEDGVPDLTDDSDDEADLIQESDDGSEIDNDEIPDSCDSGTEVEISGDATPEGSVGSASEASDDDEEEGETPTPATFERFNKIAKDVRSRLAQNAVRAFSARASEVGPEEPKDDEEEELRFKARDGLQLLKIPGYPEPFKVGSKFSSDLREKFSEIIIDGRGAFCLSLEDLRTPSSILTARIDVGDARPIYTPNYRRPPSEEQALVELTQQKIDLDLVEPSTSPWGSPVMAVRKKVESGVDTSTLKVEEVYRDVIDLRKVNEVVKADRMPIPLIQDALETATTGIVMSRLDLKMGFTQILLDEESRPITAFSTVNGHYQCKRLPMGLKSAPAIFVRAVGLALASVINKFVVAYFDDLLIISQSPEEHLDHIKEVLGLLAAAKLRAAPQKCHWFVSRVTFTGHVLEDGLIKPDPDKVRSIVRFPRPIDVTTLQSFLGLVGYYQRHIPHYSDIAYPLRILLRKTETWKWGQEQETAFRQLKTAISEEPVVRGPDWTKPFLLQTDYSAVAMGAILSQKHDEIEHIVGCASRACNVHESKYSATEGELAALVFGIKKFHRYLYGGLPFTVETDHAALAHLHRFKDQHSKLARIAILLQEYDFKVAYKRGRLNSNADALSRVPPAVNDETERTLDDAFADLPAARSDLDLTRPRTRDFEGGEQVQLLRLQDLSLNRRGTGRYVDNLPDDALDSLIRNHTGSVDDYFRDLKLPKDKIVHAFMGNATRGGKRSRPASEEMLQPEEHPEEEVVVVATAAGAPSALVPDDLIPTGLSAAKVPPSTRPPLLPPPPAPTASQAAPSFAAGASAETAPHPFEFLGSPSSSRWFNKEEEAVISRDFQQGAEGAKQKYLAGRRPSPPRVPDPLRPPKVLMDSQPSAFAARRHAANPFLGMDGISGGGDDSDDETEDSSDDGGDEDESLDLDPGDDEDQRIIRAIALSRLKPNHQPQADPSGAGTSKDASGFSGHRIPVLGEGKRARAPRREIWDDTEAVQYLKHPEFGGSVTPLSKLLVRIQNYKWFKGTLYYADREVPEPKDREEIVRQAHCNYGHKGAKSVFDLVGSRYVWHNMKETCDKIVRGCKQCEEKGFKGIVDPQLNPLPLPEFLSRGCMDLFGPLPKSRWGNVMGVLYIDYYSKWVTAAAIPDKTPTRICKFLREQIIFQRTPVEIICDRGGEFEGEDWSARGTGSR